MLSDLGGVSFSSDHSLSVREKEGFLVPQLFAPPFLLI